MAAYTTIDNPELYFQVKLYTGTGSSNALTLDGDENMQPDFVWIKIRDGTHPHEAYDSVRGVTKRLYVDAVDAETTNAGGLTAFGSDGFTVGSQDHVNEDTKTFVAWCWKETADAGFDIVSYTGNATARTISHSLSAIPHLMILRDRDDRKSWVVYHHKNTSAPETEYLLLDGNGATTDSDAYFNDTAPTSSVFTIGTGSDANASGDDFISYHWTSKQGFSKFGSYTGNGNADGNFIWLGFRPACVIIKGDNTENWSMYDNKRLGYNVDNNVLYPNATSAEGTSDDIDFLSNGFKIRRQTGLLNDANDYIFMAWAEAPLVNSKGVPCNAR